MKELLLYGLAKGETRDYMETLLLSHVYTMQEVERVIKLATDAGFHSFRVATYNGEKPDFVKALNI